MPAPVHRPSPPQPYSLSNCKVWSPHYECPICEQPFPPKQGSARPRVWHDECRPTPKDPRRFNRICPGCGTHHTIQITKMTKNPSPFCTPACKLIYKLHHRPKPTHLCSICNKNPIAHTKQTSRRYKLCEPCTDRWLYFSSMRSEDSQPIYTPEQIIRLVSKNA